jgi:hypothetical protein
MTEKPRQLSRTETHDLSMIIKDRTKVLRAHADEQSAACMADFEKKLAAEYSWDDDDTWKKAADEALAAAAAAQQIIAERCKAMGIPKTFAPRLEVSWSGRGENALAQRRGELRRVAKTSIEAMHKATLTKIERQSLDLRTQVVSMGLLSDAAKLFLESLAPIEENMRALDFAEVEKRLEREQQARIEDRRRFGY